MPRTMGSLWLAVVLGSAILWPCAAAGVAEPPSKSPPRVVIPFDFESRFDQGRYGQIVGEMIWKKLKTRGGFVLPESMLEVREWSQRTKLSPNPETALRTMKDIVTREQAGHIGIWGKVERAPGAEKDVYDLWIKIADFSVDPPRMIYDRKVRTQTVSEIPHTYVKEALDRLYGKEETQPLASSDPARDERWKKAPNLIKGDFETGGKTGPRGWDPVPRYVTWIAEPGTRPTNHLIHFAFPEEVAGSTGVLYYSDYFPIQAGATYRFQCRWRSSGSAVKVFIKCYDELAAEGSASKERREIYRSQQNLAGKSGTWNVHTEDFTPTHSRFTPRWGRVMLYGYWPAGKVDWDDLVLKQVAPAPSRPSR